MCRYRPVNRRGTRRRCSRTWSRRGRAIVAERQCRGMLLYMQPGWHQHEQDIAGACSCTCSRAHKNTDAKCCNTVNLIQHSSQKFENIPVMFMQIVHIISCLYYSHLNQDAPIGELCILQFSQHHLSRSCLSAYLHRGAFISSQFVHRLLIFLNFPCSWAN